MEDISSLGNVSLYLNLKLLIKSLNLKGADSVSISGDWRDLFLLLSPILLEYFLQKRDDSPEYFSCCRFSCVLKR